MRPKLMIPGPVELEQAVLDAMGKPTHAHYGDDWLAVHHETTEMLQQVFETQGKIYMLAGSGSLAGDAAVHSAFVPGEKVIVGNNGWFGVRMTEILVANGLEVVTVAAEPDQPLTALQFEQALQAHPDAAGVAVVHLETSTAILNPIEDIAKVVRASGDKLLLVDAVTGLAGAPLKMDEWGIDLCMGASQKALGAAPGIGIVAVSERAWHKIENRPTETRSWYLDLRRWQWYEDNWGDWHPSPVTTPTAVVLGMREALRSLLREGVAARIQRYEAMASRLRTGLEAIGMPLFVPAELMSPILTAAYCPTGTSSAQLKTYLLDKHNTQITSGFAAYKERVVRIGHMGGAVSMADIDLLLDAIGAFVAEQQPA